mmetsp:Transcript_3021/g.6291  ORF Transcript_3021/g.6291 Transcript_3021/m.6291 type:complete len:258 (-) Transcript_3021:213-986(-)
MQMLRKRSLVHMNNISTTTIVFFAVFQNSNLKCSFINNVEAVSHCPLFNDPIPLLYGNWLHYAINQFALLISDIAEHYRSFDCICNSSLLRCSFLSEKRVQVNFFLELGEILFTQNGFLFHFFDFLCLFFCNFVANWTLRTGNKFRGDAWCLFYRGCHIFWFHSRCVRDWFHQHTNDSNIICSKFILNPKIVTFVDHRFTCFQGIRIFGANINHTLICQELENTVTGNNYHPVLWLEFASQHLGFGENTEGLGHAIT